MNTNTALFVLNDNVRALACEYERIEDNPSRKLTIFKTFDKSLKVDDIVVVPTETRQNFTCVRVVDDKVEVDLDSRTPIAWIVGKVDLQAFEKLKADEAAFLSAMRDAEKHAQRQKMKDQLLATPGMAEKLEGAALLAPPKPAEE